MKRNTLFVTFLSSAAFAVGCNKAATTSEQLDKAQAKNRRDGAGDKGIFLRAEISVRRKDAKPARRAERGPGSTQRQNREIERCEQSRSKTQASCVARSNS